MSKQYSNGRSHQEVFLEIPVSVFFLGISISKIVSVGAFFEQKANSLQFFLPIFFFFFFFFCIEVQPLIGVLENSYS